MLPRLHTLPSRAAIAGLLALAAGCGEGGAGDRSFNAVVHLDPRLEDGRSPAVVLATTEHKLGEFRFDGRLREPEGHANWTLVDASVKRAPQRGGVRIVRDTGKGLAKRHATLRYSKPFDARNVDAIELDMHAEEPAAARLLWKRGEQPHTELAARVEAGPQSVRFHVGRHGNWQGRIAELLIQPVWSENQPVEVSAVRFLSLGFEPGHEPLEAVPGDEGLPGDGGLVTLHGLAIRAWPTDLGMPLFARLDPVPENAYFTTWVGGQPEGKGTGGDVLRFAVDVRSSDSDAWEPLASRETNRAEGWRKLAADVSDFAGRALELRMTLTEPDADPAKADERRRARAYFGAPRVLVSEQRAARPNVVLFTLDTIRADHLLDPDETPKITGLADTGLAFDQAWSVCNATTPAHASILSGLFIVEHGASSNRKSIPPEVTTLAELFREEGYETAAAVSAAHIEAGAGFGQGFDRFQQAGMNAYLDGRHTIEPVRRWIEGWAEEGERPFFLWIHLFDPHTPYRPPKDFLETYAAQTKHEKPPYGAEPATVPTLVDGKVPEDLRWLGPITNHEYVKYLYRAGVAYTDRLVGWVLDDLDERGLGENTAVVLTGDHGEALGEHDVYYGHAGCYPETLHVPLIVNVPGGPSGVRIAEPVSTIDIAPTLVKLAGLREQPAQSGVDLLELGRRGEGDPGRRLWFHYTRVAQVGLRDPDCHFVTTLAKQIHYGFEQAVDADGNATWSNRRVQNGDSFLWDPVADPDFERNLAEEDPERVARILEEMKAWRRSLTERKTLERAISAEEEARLDALGYGGG